MDEPITREEMFLAKAAGEDVNVPAPITRREKYLAKIAENGGGASGLPTVTSADVGKILQVTRGASTGTSIIVPEQTITYNGDPVELANANTTLFIAGTKVAATINGDTVVEYIGNDPELGAQVYFFSDDPFYSLTFFLDFETHKVCLLSEDEGTFTVALSAVNYAAEWGEHYGCTLAVKLNGNLFDASDATVIAGSSEDVCSCITAGKPYSVAVYDSYGQQLCVYSVLYGIESLSIDIDLLCWDSGADYYVANVSGGQTNIKVNIPIVFTKRLTVAADGTVTGWWSD